MIDRLTLKISKMFYLDGKSQIVTGVWKDENEAIGKLKSYFEWYMDETNKYAGIKKYLADYLSIRGFNGVAIELLI